MVPSQTGSTSAAVREKGQRRPAAVKAEEIGGQKMEGWKATCGGSGINKGGQCSRCFTILSLVIAHQPFSPRSVPSLNLLRFGEVRMVRCAILLVCAASSSAAAAYVPWSVRWGAAASRCGVGERKNSLFRKAERFGWFGVGDDKNSDGSSFAPFLSMTSQVID